MKQSILDLVLKSEKIQNAIKEYKEWGYDLDLGNITSVCVFGLSKESFKNARGAELTFYFDDCKSIGADGSYFKYKDGSYSEQKEFSLPIGYKTPKGYFSTKMIPVTVADAQNLTESEVEQLLEFYTDAKVNSFDPFWHENQAKTKNAAAWSYIAANFITDPYCTR
jgi:hypothetical protein